MTHRYAITKTCKTEDCNNKFSHGISYCADCLIEDGPEKFASFYKQLLEMRAK